MLYVCTINNSYFLSYTFISFDPCKHSVNQKTKVLEWNTFKNCLVPKLFTPLKVTDSIQDLIKCIVSFPRGKKAYKNAHKFIIWEDLCIIWIIILRSDLPNQSYPSVNYIKISHYLLSVLRVTWKNVKKPFGEIKRKGKLCLRIYYLSFTLLRWYIDDIFILLISKHMTGHRNGTELYSLNIFWTEITKEISSNYFVDKFISGWRLIISNPRNTLESLREFK